MLEFECQNLLKYPISPIFLRVMGFHSVWYFRSKLYHDKFQSSVSVVQLSKSKSKVSSLFYLLPGYSHKSFVNFDKYNHVIVGNDHKKNICLSKDPSKPICLDYKRVPLNFLSQIVNYTNGTILLVTYGPRSSLLSLKSFNSFTYR